MWQAAHHLRPSSVDPSFLQLPSCLVDQHPCRARMVRPVGHGSAHQGCCPTSVQFDSQVACHSVDSGLRGSKDSPGRIRTVWARVGQALVIADQLRAELRAPLQNPRFQAAKQKPRDLRFPPAPLKHRMTTPRLPRGVVVGWVQHGLPKLLRIRFRSVRFVTPSPLMSPAPPPPNAPRTMLRSPRSIVPLPFRSAGQLTAPQNPPTTS